MGALFELLYAVCVFERICKKAALYKHFLGGTEENNVNVQSGHLVS
jgi:hypothetical protein